MLALQARLGESASRRPSFISAYSPPVGEPSALGRPTKYPKRTPSPSGVRRKRPGTVAARERGPPSGANLPPPPPPPPPPPREKHYHRPDSSHVTTHDPSHRLAGQWQRSWWLIRLHPLRSIPGPMPTADIRSFPLPPFDIPSIQRRDRLQTPLKASISNSTVRIIQPREAERSRWG